MEIVGTVEVVTLEEVASGECVEFGGDVWFKTKLQSGNRILCARICDGKTEWVPETSIVTPIIAELRTEGVCRFIKTDPKSHGTCFGCRYQDTEECKWREDESPDVDDYCSYWEENQ